jgi:hypothetical protein
LSVRCQVAERQLLQGFERLHLKVFTSTKSDGARLKVLLDALAAELGCEVSELRLDHDPPLAARPKIMMTRGRMKYAPDANDPVYLEYRPHGPQHAGSHLIKTNVRGDHGQHPDRVLIKKARRLERGPKPKRPTSFSRAKLRSPKQKWPKRKFEKRRG